MRYLEMLAHNPDKMYNKPKNFSPAQAKEYVSGNVGAKSYSNLPPTADASTRVTQNAVDSAENQKPLAIKVANINTPTSKSTAMKFPKLRNMFKAY